MNYFESLNQYIIPVETLTDMLNVYKLQGMNEFFTSQLAPFEKSLIAKAIERDTYFLASLLPLSITENRMRLIITKDSEPRNENERTLAMIKKVLITIREDAVTYQTFNGSDLLGMLNKIFKSSKIKFVTTLYQPKNKQLRHKPVSIRLLFEHLLEDYHEAIKNDTYEHLHLAMIAYMQMSCLEPFSEYNEIGEILFLYYVIFKEKMTPFKYVSFLDIYLKHQSELIVARETGSINYPEGRFVLNDVMRVFFIIIKEAYSELNNLIKDCVRDDKANKSDTLEETIYQIPCGGTFTKEELRLQNPNISETTINRILIKLKNEGVIRLVGSGRTARWIKVLADDDPKMIFGRNYERTD